MKAFLSSYLPWAIIALVTYGIANSILKVVFRSIHPSVGLTVANTFVVLAGVGWIIMTGPGVFRNVGWNVATGRLLIAGVILAVAIASLYKSLSLGPASVVIPIFALSLTVAAIIGFTLLGEPVKPTRIVGLVLAAFAIVLLTR